MKDPDPYTVLVTGSRGFSDRNLMLRILKELDDSLPGRAITLVHGAAKGADAAAAVFAPQLGWRVIAVPADWNGLGRSAGPERNTKMLDDYRPDIVLAFPRGASPGTRDCIRKAKRRQILVVEY